VRGVVGGTLPELQKSGMNSNACMVSQQSYAWVLLYSNPCLEHAFLYGMSDLSPTFIFVVFVSTPSYSS